MAGSYESDVYTGVEDAGTVDVTQFDAVTGAIKDAIQEVNEGICTSKIVRINGEALSGLTGLCVTRYPDQIPSSGIEFRITSQGDIVYLGADINFADNTSFKFRVRTKCVEDGNCDLSQATSPLGELLMGQFNLQPIGDVDILAESGENGVVTFKVLDGSGEIKIFHNGEEIGSVSAPTQNEQNMGLVNVGELEIESSQFSTRQALRLDVNGAEDSKSKKKEGSNYQSMGCNTGETNHMMVPHFDMAMFLALLYVVARKLGANVANLPVAITKATKSFAENITNGGK